MTETAAFPSDRTAVLTGAASARGIGRATADRLAREGWNIAILDIDGAAAEEAAADIAQRNGVKAIGVGADVADEASVDAAISRIEAELPPIVALANLAGISSPTEFMKETKEAWERVFAVNMTGTFLVTQRVLHGMIDRKLGRVVSISSISAQRGGGTYSKVAYSASKAGIIGFTRALAREMGEHGITVNCIAPGPVDTDIMGGTLTEERKRDMSKDILVGRVGTVDEMAALISFLVGPDAGFITAATYDINGGLQVS
ncbi:SDR family NAD(P)-dependent oxidoreductase [Arthrobacter subterraneus]|uniref:SDR family NAD(P)-dependent oxidoreductase n=1 Tax=Arthrobacter subterraneus TaxID=335973 RepID=UPI003801DE81